MSAINNFAVLTIELSILDVGVCGLSSVVSKQYARHIVSYELSSLTTNSVRCAT